MYVVDVLLKPGGRKRHRDTERVRVDELMVERGFQERERDGGTFQRAFSESVDKHVTPHTCWHVNGTFVCVRVRVLIKSYLPLSVNSLFTVNHVVPQLRSQIQ